jgi:hypothetical protein
MRTILLSGAAIVAVVVIAATAAIDMAQAASRFDGSWAVQIITRRGACDPSSSFGVQIHDGIVSGPASGRYLITAPFVSASLPEARMQAAVDACPQAPAAALGAA